MIFLCEIGVLCVLCGEKRLFEAEEDHQEQKRQYDPTG
jgi:hypothetical protein